jgi:hypothetical protein
LAVLRHETFFSLAELNARIRALLDRLNDRPMRAYRASRRDLFERLDQPALRPLPAQPFVFAEWKLAKVNIDYHVELDGHYYSVPHALVGEHVELRFTAGTVEAYSRGQRVASHLRSRHRGRHTTDPSHMPKSHQKHMAWTPSRLIHWGESVGEAACARAHRVRARSYRHVESILKNGLDRVGPRDARTAPQPSLPLHENVRGSDYYDNTPPTEGETNDAQ